MKYERLSNGGRLRNIVITAIVFLVVGITFGCVYIFYGIDVSKSTEARRVALSEEVNVRSQYCQQLEIEKEENWEENQIICLNNVANLKSELKAFDYAAYTGVCSGIVIILITTCFFCIICFAARGRVAQMEAKKPTTTTVRKPAAKKAVAAKATPAKKPATKKAPAKKATAKKKK